MKNYWKFIVIGLLFSIAAFHIGAVIYVTGDAYELTSSDYYAQEQGHSKLMARLEAGKRFVWQVDLGETGLDLVVRDPAGKQLSLADGQARLYKPDDSSQDRQLQLAQAEDGAYRGEASGLKTGLWRLTVEGELDGQPVAYQAILRKN